MTEYPKISAILPCYNHEPFLATRINSVLSQTQPVSQIIFLDDASSDGSLDLARKLLAGCLAEVVFCANSTNSGSPFAQWNVGVRQAKHPYIWIAETDDTCEPQLLEKLYCHLSCSGAVISFVQSRYIDENGTDRGSALSYTDHQWPGQFAKDFDMGGGAFNSTYMSALNAIPNASAVLFSRDAYLRAGMANQSMRFCGDWDAWIRLAEQGSVAFVAEELNGFRCHQHTTRAKGYTPQVAAEFFACRLRACLGSNQSLLSRINALQLLRLLCSQDSACLKFALNSLNWNSFSQSRSHYLQLKNIPALSRGVWIIIALRYFKVFTLQKLSRFARRFSSLL